MSAELDDGARFVLPLQLINDRPGDADQAERDFYGWGVADVVARLGLTACRMGARFHISGPRAALEAFCAAASVPASKIQSLQ